MSTKTYNEELLDLLISDAVRTGPVRDGLSPTDVLGLVGSVLYVRTLRSEYPGPTSPRRMDRVPRAAQVRQLDQEVVDALADITSSCAELLAETSAGARGEIEQAIGTTFDQVSMAGPEQVLTGIETRARCLWLQAGGDFGHKDLEQRALRSALAHLLGDTFTLLSTLLDRGCIEVGHETRYGQLRVVKEVPW